MQHKAKPVPDQDKHQKMSKEEMTNCVCAEAQLNTKEVLADEPVLRFAELLTFTKVGKSKAYELMNPKERAYDPKFPTGFPLFDSPRSPKVYWRHEAMAWLEGRSNNFRNQQKGN